MSLTSLLILVAAQTAPAAPTLAQETWRFDVAGTARTALVHRPQPGTGLAPVVMAFHGHGGSGSSFANSVRLTEAWPEAWAIYPDGLPTASTRDPEGKKSGWDNARPATDSRDLAFVDALLRRLGSESGVDATRIFAMGHSNGGAMIYGLWAARADRFAGFAPSAAAGARGLTAAKPAFVLMGEADAIVSPELQRASLAEVRRLNGAQGEAKVTGFRHDYPGGTPTAAYIHPEGHRFPAEAVPSIVEFFKSLSR